MRATHRDAEQRYTHLRGLALQIAESKLKMVVTGLSLQLITDSALRAWREWDASERLVDWNWSHGYRTFQFRNPKRFELAIWVDGKLISLSLGRPTYHGAGLRLDFLEACHAQNRIRVFPIVFAALTVYAEAIGATQIRLVNPINDVVKAYYEKSGFIYVAKGDYLFINT